jgi:cbb3-type cytochrome oxidase maturation protein
MFIPLWLVYLFTGTLMAVLTLFWAVRSRQFDDQERARYIPLAALTPAELDTPARRAPTSARVAIGAILAVGFSALILTLIVVLRS